MVRPWMSKIIIGKAHLSLAVAKLQGKEELVMPYRAWPGNFEADPLEALFLLICMGILPHADEGSTLSEAGFKTCFGEGAIIIKR